MTIYEMNKEQIIETVKAVSDRFNISVCGLWTNLTHSYRKTMVLVEGEQAEEFEDLLDDVMNGIRDINGNVLMSAYDRYCDGYESCDIQVTKNIKYFNDILTIYKGVNWINGRFL